MALPLFVGGLAGVAAAQQSGLRTESVPGPLRDRGTYEFATGTWTRAHDTGTTKVLYNNDANTGFFGLMSVPMRWYDEGRLPGTADPNLPQAKADAYLINGFQIAYCTSQGPAGQFGRIAFYEAYSSCTNPLPLTPDFDQPFAGPGSSAAGVTACWIVTFDLTGSGLEFQLDAEADGIFDNDCALDSFGWKFELRPVGGGNAGPLLNGDPNNFPEGDGTYYQNPGSTGTGLCTQDQFWLISATGTPAAGCYWFGGYPANPYGSFWLQVLGENADGVDNCTKYCQATDNSAPGGPASIASTCTFTNLTLPVTASPVPNQPGIFFHAMNQVRLAFGNGFLCAAQNIVRTGVVVGSGFQATRVINFQQYTGQRRHVQYWFRDPAAGGAFFNTSNAITVNVP